MLPFSVTRQRGAGSAGASEPALARPEVQSGCELIAFDGEKLNLFAARVRYCEPHWHPAAELITVVSGGFAVAMGARYLSLTAGDVLYVNGEEVHSLCASVPDSRLLTVQFSPGLFDRIHPAPLLDYHTAGRRLTDRDRQVQCRLRQLLSAMIDGEGPFLRIAAAYTLVDALVRAGEVCCPDPATVKETAQIKKGISYINQHFERALTLDEVAEHAGMSYAWFSRLFKRISRRTFKEYLTQARVNKARTLLRDTHMPITEISYLCGFPQHKYLIAAFNKYCGVTPTQYRKQALSPQAEPQRGSEGDDCICQPLNGTLLRCLAEGFRQRGRDQPADQ